MLKKVSISILLFIFSLGFSYANSNYEKIDNLLFSFYVKLENKVDDNEGKIDILKELNIKIEKIKNKKPVISNSSLLILKYIENSVNDKIVFYGNSNTNNNIEVNERVFQDFLTPDYYNDNSTIKGELNNFLNYVYLEKLQNPLQDIEGLIPEYNISDSGSFGSLKGTGNFSSHHSANDFYIGRKETDVPIYASHDGIVNVYENAAKWRDYITVTKEIKDNNNEVIGKLVTMYAHVDKNNNERSGLLLDGKYVEKGDLISNYLYSGTKGGAHLHYSIRFYRSNDKGNEEFYGFGGNGLTESSLGDWEYGKWNPNVGYGYANPANFGIK